MAKVYLLDGKLLCVGEWEVTDTLPEGAVVADVELATIAIGSVVLASDYEALRRAEYPPLRDQLDAVWKGGAPAEEMRVLVQSIKDKYPKP